VRPFEAEGSASVAAPAPQLEPFVLMKEAADRFTGVVRAWMRRGGEARLFGLAAADREDHQREKENLLRWTRREFDREMEGMERRWYDRK
jgi:uncharacterized damage-inducible protein DinB